MAVKAGSVIPLYDATIDTVRDSESDKVIPLKKRDHLLYLWCFPNSKGEIPRTVSNGVHVALEKTTE